MKKYYLVSQESLFEKNVVILFTKTDEKWSKFSKKFQTPAISKKNASWLIALTVLKEQARGLAYNGLPAKTT